VIGTVTGARLVGVGGAEAGDTAGVGEGLGRTAGVGFGFGVGRGVGSARGVGEGFGDGEAVGTGGGASSGIEEGVACGVGPACGTSCAAATAIDGTEASAAIRPPRRKVSIPPATAKAALAATRSATRRARPTAGRWIIAQV
jgi:hypothetical protein